MDPDLRARISALLGRHVTAWRPALGGYTAAERWICTLEDGQSAFAKVAVDTRTAQWLREEHHASTSPVVWPYRNALVQLPNAPAYFSVCLWKEA